MKKIIPILTVIVSAVAAAFSIIGLITVSVATAVPQISLVAVPTAIIAFTISALASPLALVFRRDRLCRIAFIIDTVALTISVISLIVWLVAL